MKTLGCFLLLIFWTTALGQEPVYRLHAERIRPGSPWLGIHTAQMEPATAAQLNEVPEGFGILIEQVEPDSPASEAGLRAMDVLWKYDDQLLANRGQLFALMKMTGVHQDGVLTVSRRGENLSLPITIGLRPDNRKELAEIATEVLMPPLPGDVVRQLDLGKRSGFISEGGVTVSLARNVNGYGYSVIKGEEVVSEGVLEGQDVAAWPASLDDKTRRKLQVLFDSLKNAERRETAPRPRVPRVRRVPVALAEDKK